MTLTDAVVTELYKSDRVSEVIRSTLRGEITFMSTGRAEFQTWEKETGDELKVDLATITASGPLTTPGFWTEVVEARGKILIEKTGITEGDKMWVVQRTSREGRARVHKATGSRHISLATSIDFPQRRQHTGLDPAEERRVSQLALAKRRR